ncbi:MAG: xanthine dehydrogenase family protein molybdopterin-binding subunit [Dehalococcoidia bacterium]|nr:xanthine dehydrogenase family protein molybdopterin-binding subunit [Dehalococcoidia bacterium]
MASNYRHIGKDTPRKDARDIVTGRAQYLDDVRLPWMLFGRALRSPHPHANIRNIDVSRAAALRGVHAVLTYKDVPDWEWGIPNHMRILDKKVRFVGDAVALVAAEGYEIADEALELIDVEYEPLPTCFDVEDATAPGQPQLYDQYPNNIIPQITKLLQNVVRGDVEKGFAEADVIIEGTGSYECFPNPLPPEPPGVIAYWENPDKLVVYTASQSVALNKYIGQPFIGMADMQVISTQCGGSYGTKNANLTPIGYAAVLSRATGRPVKVYYSKEEHFAAYSLRIGSRIHARVGIKKDGTVTAVAGDWLVNTGSGSEAAPHEIAVGCGELQLALRCPNWDLHSTLVCTNRAPTGIVRGYGGQELESSMLPIMGMAMEKAGVNPVDFFKKNFIKAGDEYYWRNGQRYVYRGIDFSVTIDKGAEAFGWHDKWHGWGKPTAVDGQKRRGVGLGIHCNADVGEDHSEAMVKLTPDGRALVLAAVSEAGQGQRSSLCKMAAEVLNLPLDRVNMTRPDTDINPFEFALVGSRGTYTVGSAVIQAAEDARRILLELAAPVLNVEPDALDTEDGWIFVVDEPERRIPWRKATGIVRTVIGQGRFEEDFTLSNFLITFVEVEVDTATGQVKLMNVVNSTDCGQIISPTVLEGQLHGALGAAGLDTAIFEGNVLDIDTGRMLNSNLIDYKWRTFKDLPPFTNVILETPMPSHRFHAVGVGEIATSPGPSAVLMAVYNAIGRRIMDYPFTPDKVLNALGKIK